MKRLSIRNLVLSGVFIALGLVLPFLTAQIPSLGSRFLPMHLPVLIAGFVCGWQYGLVVGFIVPIFRSMLFGMPPMMPTAAAMAVELAVYGCMTGLMYKLLPKRNVFIYVALILSMICGRIAWGLAGIFLYGLGGTAFTWELFMAGAFINAVPGIIIQIIIIPIIIMALNKAKVMQDERAMQNV
ncbi:MAG: ECF transporter S component [Gracilibacteraceae bacterium]|nr:ECF transporter S component [Gracilibacteraceae bacterium]